MSRRLDPAWWLVGPALAILAVFFLGPVLASFALSLTDFDVYAIADLDRLRFVGVGNYRTLLESPRLWLAVRNTAYFVLVGGPLSIAASLGASSCSTHAPCAGSRLDHALLPAVTTLVPSRRLARALPPARGHARVARREAGIADRLARDPLWAMPAIILTPSGRTSAQHARLPAGCRAARALRGGSARRRRALGGSGTSRCRCRAHVRLRRRATTIGYP